MFDTLKARFYLSSSSSQPVEALMWRHRGALAANLQLNRGGCTVHGSAASPLIYKAEI